VAGDIRLQLSLGGGKTLLGLVDRVHDLQLFFLKTTDLRLRRFDLVREGPVFVVLSHLQLLGAVFGRLALRALDFDLQELLFRFQPLPFCLGGLDGLFLGGDPGFNGRNLARHRLQLLFEDQSPTVAFLKHEQLCDTEYSHVATTVAGDIPRGQLKPSGPRF